MTPNERKILKYLWDAKGRAHIKVVSQNIGFTADYTRLLCHSLARAGYLVFADASTCCLLAKGRDRFQRNGEPRSRRKISRQPLLKKTRSQKQQKKETAQASLKNAPTAGLGALKDATPEEKEKLVAAGYKSLEDVAETPINRLIQGLGISLEKAAHWINHARRQTWVINEGDRKNKE